MNKIKILLVEDHAVLRQGLKLLFNGEPDIEVVGEAANGREGIALLAKLQPDMVVMDISMPELNGIEATRQIRQQYPQIKIVILSMHPYEEYVLQVLKTGALAYVLKHDDVSELLKAIRIAISGKIFLSSSITGLSINEWLERAEEQYPVSNVSLTRREKEILQLLAKGLSNNDIAKQLIISIKTVETHRTNMANKFNVKGKADLILYAMRQGWVTVEN